jgi:IS5 family transposase
VQRPLSAGVLIRGRCGRSSTSGCSKNCPKSRSWTGPAPASTRCPYGPKGGQLTGPNPTDRGKPGTKYHLLTDRNGLPLHVLASAANVHDSRLFEPLLETNSGVRSRRGRPGRPRRRPEKLHADKGYDYPKCRRYLHRRGIKVRIARRGTEDKNHLGRHRWVVERTISWVLRFKRLGIRYDRTATTLVPLLLLAVTLINLRRLCQTTGL